MATSAAAERWDGFPLLLASGLVVGTIVNSAIAILYRLLAMLAIQVTSSGTIDSPARYATWPLFFQYCSRVLSAREILFGAVGGLLIALTLHFNRESRARVALWSALAFSLVYGTKKALAGAAGTTVFLGVFGDLVRGAVLGWTALELYSRWRSHETS